MSRTRTVEDVDSIIERLRRKIKLSYVTPVALNRQGGKRIGDDPETLWQLIDIWLDERNKLTSPTKVVTKNEWLQPSSDEDRDDQRGAESVPG